MQERTICDRCTAFGSAAPGNWIGFGMYPKPIPHRDLAEPGLGVGGQAQVEVRSRGYPP
jgi:hypothetical protein